MEIPFLGSKKEAEESKGRGFVPTERVNELMSRGFSELDTIDVLRREGFSPDEIDKGLTQAIKEGVVGSSYQKGDEEPEGEDFENEYRRFRSNRTEMNQPAPQQSRQDITSARRDVSERESRDELRLPTIEDLELPQNPTGNPEIPETSLPEEYYQGYPAEEYVGYLVQERTSDLASQISEISLKNRELENMLKEMYDRVKELSKMRIGEQQQVLNTIEGLTDSVNDVNMRIASLEKAFKETLPALIESVRALCDLVQRMKREA